MRWMQVIIWLGILALLAAPGGGARAQTDSTGAGVPLEPRRTSWVSGFMALRAGDLVTIVIDEEVLAREKAANSGSNQRTLNANLSLNTGTVDQYGLAANWNAQSRTNGEATRQGGLSGVMSATVVAVNAAGIATVEGKKTVSIDGRNQEMTLRGLVRPQDLSCNNVISSNRLADATIAYKGKKMGPQQGIIGKVLSIVWPF